jgi:hypothetical protein
VSTGFVGFVLGVAAPVAMAELRSVRRRRRVMEDTTEFGRHAPDWDTTMPLPRTAMRPRWESNSDPADEDDLAEFLVTVGLAVLLTAGVLLTSSSLPGFLSWLLLGAVVGMLGLAVHAMIVGRQLPPGARHVVSRGVGVAFAATLALLWVGSTRYHLLSISTVRSALVKVSLTHRPGEVHAVFGTDGVLLVATVALGMMLAIGLVVAALVDLTAMFAATRLGEGSRRAFTGWLAQLYPRRQLRLWVSAALVALAAFLLCSGAVLRWYDHYKANSEVHPATPPIVAVPPGTVLPPATTTTTARSTTTTTGTTIATTPGTTTGPTP